MAVVYVVQHGEKERSAGDPGLTARGRVQAALAAERLRGAGLTGVFSSPLRRAREAVDLLRTLLGDDGVPEPLLREGVPSGAVTTLRGLEVVEIASTSHLGGSESAHRP